MRGRGFWQEKPEKRWPISRKSCRCQWWLTAREIGIEMRGRGTHPGPEKCGNRSLRTLRPVVLLPQVRILHLATSQHQRCLRLCVHCSRPERPGICAGQRPRKLRAQLPSREWQQHAKSLCPPGAVAAVRSANGVLGELLRGDHFHPRRKNKRFFH